MPDVEFGYTPTTPAFAVVIAAQEVGWVKQTLAGADANAFIKEMRIYLDGSSGAQTQYVCVWRDSDDVLLAYGIPTVTAGQGWKTVSRANITLVNGGLTPNGVYRLGYHCVIGGGNGRNQYRDTSDVSISKARFPYAGALPPDPSGAVTDNGPVWAIGVTVGLDGSGTTTQNNPALSRNRREHKR